MTEILLCMTSCLTLKAASSDRGQLLNFFFDKMILIHFNVNRPALLLMPPFFGGEEMTNQSFFCVGLKKGLGYLANTDKQTNNYPVWKLIPQIVFRISIPFFHVPDDHP